MARTKREKAADRIEMAHAKKIAKTYGGSADGIAHYIEQLTDRLHGLSYGGSEKEFQAVSRELDAAQSALAMVGEGE